MKFWKKNNIPADKKIVMTFGSFDFLHAGHEHYLKQAKALGDFLIVIIARDATIRSTKGHQSTHNEKERLRNLEKLGLADLVILGSHGDKHQVILDYQPDIIALGYDQFVFTQTLNKTIIKNNLNCQIVRLDAYFPQVFKSSIIARNISENKPAIDLAQLEVLSKQ